MHEEGWSLINSLMPCSPNATILRMMTAGCDIWPDRLAPKSDDLYTWGKDIIWAWLILMPFHRLLLHYEWCLWVWTLVNGISGNDQQWNYNFICVLKVGCSVRIHLNAFKNILQMTSYVYTQCIKVSIL